jgi:hypothetical protein
MAGDPTSPQGRTVVARSGSTGALPARPVAINPEVTMCPRPDRTDVEHDSHRIRAAAAPDYSAGATSFPRRRAAASAGTERPARPRNGLRSHFTN